MTSLGILLLFIVAALLVLAAAGWGTFLLLVQLGVIVKEAGKGQHSDSYDYSLSQGREVGRNDQQQ